MKYKKILGVLIVAAIIVVGIAVSAAQNGPKTDNVIKIGVAIPLTGNQGFVGEGLRNAVLLAESKLKNTNTKYKYDVVFEDVQIDPKLAASAAQKLINIDKVDAIIDAYAPIGNAIAPIAEQSHVVQIGIAFDPRVASGTYNFIHFTAPDTAARTFLEEMNKRGLKTLGIFHLNNPGIKAIYDSVIKLSPEYNISIVSDQEFQPGDRDFKSIITKASPSKADIYALLSIPPELDILAKQMDDLNLRNQTSIIYFELSPNKALYEGLWSIGYGVTKDSFAQEYKDTYNKEPTFGVPNAYDALNLIVNAAESYKGAGKPSTAFIAEQIQNVRHFEGALGELNVNSEGIIDSPVSVKVVKDGVLVPVY